MNSHLRGFILTEHTINNAFFASLACVALLGVGGGLVQSAQTLIVHAATHSTSLLHPVVVAFF